MELFDLKTSQVMNIILKDCQEINGFNEFSKEDQRTIILNAITRNVVMEEIRNMIDYIINKQFK